jgi:hypothetical protein
MSRRCELDVLRMLEQAPAPVDRGHLAASLPWGELALDEALADLVARGLAHLDLASRCYQATGPCMEAL